MNFLFASEIAIWLLYAFNFFLSKKLQDYFLDLEMDLKFEIELEKETEGQRFKRICGIFIFSSNRNEGKW